jgi:hypothetical protein
MKPSPERTLTPEGPLVAEVIQPMRIAPGSRVAQMPARLVAKRTPRLLSLLLSATLGETIYR